MHLRDAPDPHGPKLDQHLLEPLRVMAQLALHPQVVHDLKVRSEWDPILRHILVNVETHIYRHKDDVETRTVHFKKTKWVPFARPVMLSTMFGAFTFAISCLTMVGFIPSWEILLTAWAFYFPMLCYTILIDQGDTVTVEGEAVFEKTQWSHFPDNSMIFPEGLGQPVIFIVQKEHPEYHG